MRKDNKIRHDIVQISLVERFEKYIRRIKIFTDLRSLPPMTLYGVINLIKNRSRKLFDVRQQHFIPRTMIDKWGPGAFTEMIRRPGGPLQWGFIIHHSLNVRMKCKWKSISNALLFHMKCQRIFVIIRYSTHTFNNEIHLKCWWSSLLRLCNNSPWHLLIDGTLCVRNLNRDWPTSIPTNTTPWIISRDIKVGTVCIL